ARSSVQTAPKPAFPCGFARFPWIGLRQLDAKVVPAVIARCSTIGPSASAGKNVRPPTIRITPTVSPTNSPPVVGNVPADGGIDFFAASEPAIAIAGTIIQKRPTNIATAPVRL